MDECASKAFVTVYYFMYYLYLLCTIFVVAEYSHVLFITSRSISYLVSTILYAVETSLPQKYSANKISTKSVALRL